MTPEQLQIFRVWAAEWAVQEYPLSGYDILQKLNSLGCCSQQEADSAIAIARDNVEQMRGEATAEPAPKWVRDYERKLQSDAGPAEPEKKFHS